MSETNSAQTVRRPPSDRRQEPRIPSKGLADLVVLDPPKFERLTATVVNVSRSGFQIDIGEPIEEGGRIEIRLKDVIASGIVMNCRENGEGGYRAGVRTVE